MKKIEKIDMDKFLSVCLEINRRFNLPQSVPDNLRFKVKDKGKIVGDYSLNFDKPEIRFMILKSNIIHEVVGRNESFEKLYSYSARFDSLMRFIRTHNEKLLRHEILKEEQNGTSMVSYELMRKAAICSVKKNGTFDSKEMFQLLEIA